MSGDGVEAALLVLRIVGPITQVEPVAQRVRTLTSPVDPPVRLNIAMVLGTVAASTERALRLRYSRILDGTAG
ncbi:hypothetical protein [Streptomyces mayteni]